MPALIPIDLDTAVLMALNLIGWGLFICVIWRDRRSRLRLSPRRAG